MDFIHGAIIISIMAMSNMLLNGDAAKNGSRELQALMNFGWPRINSTTHHCTWEGITCDAAGRVEKISLQQKECETQPHCYKFESLDMLAFPFLTSIHLAYCGLYGAIPSQIGSLSKLTYLNLSGYLLSSRWPLSLANLTLLRVLDVSGNYFYGPISPEIGSLSQLTYLNLSNNGNDANYPPSLANLTKLRVLDISHNYVYQSPIPLEIGSLSSLTHLYLSHNGHYGDFPFSLSNYTKLQVLDISSNFFSLPILHQLGNIRHLYYLDIRDNYIYDSLPSKMINLTKLKFLKLDSNGIRDVFEAGLEKLPSIEMIGLSGNFISGEIPSQFGDVANAKFLDIDLSHNHLYGRVPESLSCLKGINLAYNWNLEGQIPLIVWRKFGEVSFENINIAQL